MNDITGENAMEAEPWPELVVDAIYEDGVIRPLAPLDLPNHTSVHVRVVVSGTNDHTPPAMPSPPSAPAMVAQGVARSVARLRAAAVAWDRPQIQGNRLDLTLFGLGLGVYLLTRFWDLVRFPIFFFCDEAIQVVMAADLRANGLRDHAGNLLPMYFDNAGQWNPGLTVYIHMLSLMLFGKSEVVTRATSAAVSVLAPIAIALMLRLVFRLRFWWAGVVVTAALPVWFLHTRTAFETVMMTAFYACFLCLYLLYRYKDPGYLYAALIFGGMTVYSYSSGAGLMLISGVLLLFSDLRYHLRNWPVTMIGAALLLLLLTIPLVRFIRVQPDALSNPLDVRLSYWIEHRSLIEKLQIFGHNYLQGISPRYWFVPNGDDLVRHRMKGMGHIQLWLLPFATIGLFVCLRRWRSPAHRTILIALLATPFAAALVSIGVTRVLVFIVPATLLICLGLEQCYSWLRRYVPYRAVAAVLCVVLSLVSFGMLRTALADGPTWYANYGLGGMQYGAPQLFAVIPQILDAEPETRIMLSPTWANNPDVFAPFYLTKAQQARLDFGNVDGFMVTRRPLDLNTLFIMTTEEYERALVSRKFIMLQPERTLPYPDGQPGFFFVRMSYVPNIDALIAADRQARAKLIIDTGVIDGQAVEVRHSLLDGGTIANLFDHNPHSLIRGLEANPFVLELYFVTPRTATTLGLDVGTMDSFAVRVQVTQDDGSQQETTQQYTGLPNDPHIDLPLPGGTSHIIRMRVEVTNQRAGASTHIHVRSLDLK